MKKTGEAACLFSFKQDGFQYQFKYQIIMNSKVKVTGDVAGNVIVPSKNNPEWGYIRVEQDRMLVDENGFARKKTISALVHGTIADLKGFNWKVSQETEGKIIFKEQLKPFNETEPERDYKVAGKTGVICTVEGQPIYRKTFYSINENAVDTPLAHDNMEAIKAAYAEVEQESPKKSTGKIDRV